MKWRIELSLESDMGVIVPIAATRDKAIISKAASQILLRMTKREFDDPLLNLINQEEISRLQRFLKLVDSEPDAH